MMFADVLVAIPLKAHGDVFTYSVPEKLADKVRYGVRVDVKLRNRKVRGFVICVHDSKPDFETSEILHVTDKEPVFTEKQLELAAWMADFYVCSRGEALSTMIPSGKRDSNTAAFDPDDCDNRSVGELSAAQKSALEKINAGETGLFYLYGVTGSGKTEVFLRAAEETIRKGRQVIYLVPEITLTHQLSALVTGRFKGRVAILHSGLTASQRLKAWHRILAGEVDIAIGARSAVFAPFENLGLIIVDEEHDGSYKSGDTPRYNCRQVAQHRASKEGAKLLMGSATPSLEAFRLMEEGSIARLDLPSRVAGGKPPVIEVVRMEGEKSLISDRLDAEIKRVLSRGKQVILFLNRRGYSYHFHCRSCGYEMTCPNCSITLTYHKSSGSMVCHYCGYKTEPIQVCPKCSSLDVGYYGFGTEMVEEEVRRRYPAAGVLRLDQDSAQGKDTVASVLADFKAGKAKILLGTQMIAKGLNFPDVELVGIVLADSGLGIPDFRAEERTFALITQVAGRAGRYSSEGKVIIQTFKADWPAIRFAAEGNNRDFYSYELSEREANGFPPFRRLLSLTLRYKDKDTVKKETEKLYRLSKAFLTQLKESGNCRREDVPEPIGMAECPIEKMNSSYRYHMLFRSSNPRLLSWLAKCLLLQDNFKLKSYLEIDIDPLQLL